MTFTGAMSVFVIMHDNDQLPRTNVSLMASFGGPVIIGCSDQVVFRAKWTS